MFYSQKTVVDERSNASTTCVHYNVKLMILWDMEK